MGMDNFLSNFGNFIKPDCAGELNSIFVRRRQERNLEKF